MKKFISNMPILGAQILISQILILFILILYPTKTYTINTHTINTSFLNYFFKKKAHPTKIFSTKIKNATETLLNETLEKTKNIIYTLIGPRKSDMLDATLKISIIAVTTAITGYAIKKITTNNKTKQKELAENKAKINGIIENFNFNSPGQENKLLNTNFNNNSNNIYYDNYYTQALEQNRSSSMFVDNKKWALWQNDMPFLELLQIPQAILFQKLIQDIKKIYKSSNQENIIENKYLLDLFIKDIESEIYEYQKKYNIILISNNFDKKQECLLKIKDNIKKLIYLKNTADYWINKQMNFS
ncbi:MAG: hypothetical protein UR12_C0002G0019 [candidate division TM6 bacterium GW2011_GWF2_30_66]|jgi:hypothetical protein|nr:MAG: hypothetical protein UR12_C0002G0019 [candidate division TM6 bacterium GW2011_GWF2_30_66]